MNEWMNEWPRQFICALRKCPLPIRFSDLKVKSRVEVSVCSLRKENNSGFLSASNAHPFIYSLTFLWFLKTSGTTISSFSPIQISAILSSFELWTKPISVLFYPSSGPQAICEGKAQRPCLHRLHPATTNPRSRWGRSEVTLIQKRNSWKKSIS